MLKEGDTMMMDALVTIYQNVLDCSEDCKDTIQERKATESRKPTSAQENANSIMKEVIGYIENLKNRAESASKISKINHV